MGTGEVGPTALLGPHRAGAHGTVALGDISQPEGHEWGLITLTPAVPWQPDAAVSGPEAGGWGSHSTGGVWGDAGAEPGGAGRTAPPTRARAPADVCQWGANPAPWPPGAVPVASQRDPVLSRRGTVMASTAPSAAQPGLLRAGAGVSGAEEEPCEPREAAAPRRLLCAARRRCWRSWGGWAVTAWAGRALCVLSGRPVTRIPIAQARRLSPGQRTPRGPRQSTCGSLSEGTAGACAGAEQLGPSGCAVPRSLLVDRQPAGSEVGEARCGDGVVYLASQGVNLYAEKGAFGGDTGA